MKLLCSIFSMRFELESITREKELSSPSRRDVLA